MIEEIPDDNEWKNQTINSINDDMDLLISYIDGDMDRNIWINAKSTTATEIQAEMETAPTSMTKGLEDWKIEMTNGQNILFFKRKNYLPRNMDLRREIVICKELRIRMWHLPAV